MYDEALRNAPVSRRVFLATSAGAAAILPQVVSASAVQDEKGPFQATGTRVGEVTENSAIVWTRLTSHAERNNDGVVFEKTAGRQKNQPVTIPVEQIEGACPGTAGRI